MENPIAQDKYNFYFKIFRSHLNSYQKLPNHLHFQKYYHV